MSQIIAVKNSHGILLAADGLAADFTPDGKLVPMEVNRLIQLSGRTAVLAGGAAEGVKMCHNLREFISEEGLETAEEVYGAALPFLATEYERFMRKNCEMLPLDPIHHVHFIIAGYSEQDPDPHRLHLVWTKKKLPQLDGDDIGSAFAVPRSLRLEYRLNRFHKDNTVIEQILPEVKAGLEELAKGQEEIGGPFSYASITAEGFRRLE